MKVKIKLNNKYAHWIRQGTTAEIHSQGLMGDKMIVLSTGQKNTPQLDHLGTIQTTESKTLASFVSEGDELVGRLKSITLKLDQVLIAFTQENRTQKILKNIDDTLSNIKISSQTLNEQKVVHKLDQVLIQLIE